MQTKTIALFALTASAAVASPFHKRAELNHHRFHGTGSHGIRPTGTGRAFPAGNDTEGVYAPTGAPTMTVSPLPAESGSVPNTFGNVATDDATSSSCVSTSLVTETSTNLFTVTASAADLANTKVVEASSVSAGAFYDNSRTRGGNRGQSSSAAATGSISVPSVSAPPAANPSTTFAVVPSASKSSDAGASASTPAAASASTSASAPPTGSSGGKRGISYNTASLVSAFGSSVSWAYNWGSTPDGTLNVEYVPMMWGRNEVSGFAGKVGSATHVLSFNEPDLGAQANILASDAVDLHNQGMSSLVGKVKIGSPAVTNGGGDMGITWLDNFLTACGSSKCNVDFVAYHWYDTADHIDYFIQHTKDVIKMAADHGISKVWLTEFQPSGSADAQASFMKQAVEFLDGNDSVERYAAFMASDDTMLSGGKLNTLGSAYASA